MEFAEAAAGARRFRYGELPEREAACQNGGRDADSDFGSAAEGYDARWERAAAAVRIRQLWIVDAGNVQFESIESPRPRGGLCDCAYPRRRRVGQAVARRGANASEDEHIHGFPFVRGLFVREEIYVAGAAGD